MTEKRFLPSQHGNSIEMDGKLLNIDFAAKKDAKLCCTLFNQICNEKQRYIDELNEILIWYQAYHDENIIITKFKKGEREKLLILIDEKINKLKNIQETYVRKYKASPMYNIEIGINLLQKLKSELGK